jgi:hypothetical protein
VSFGVWLARRWEEKRKKDELIKKINQVNKKLEVHQLKRLCLDLLDKIPVGEIRQDPKTEEDYEIKKPVSEEEYIWFLNLYMKTKKLEPEKVMDYIIKQKIVSADFFYFQFQKKMTNDVSSTRHAKLPVSL